MGVRSLELSVAWFGHGAVLLVSMTTAIAARVGDSRPTAPKMTLVRMSSTVELIAAGTPPRDAASRHEP